jgi:hypothetical protein
MHTLWAVIVVSISLLLTKHDFHASMTKIEYSAKTQSLQCIMNIFTDDLELALSNFHHREIKYKEKETDNEIIPYLNKVFVIKTKKNKVLPITYIGSTRKPNTVQVYFEILCDKNELKYLLVTHTLLFTEFEDQVNTVNFYVLSEKKSLVFTISEGTKAITF